MGDYLLVGPPYYWRATRRAATLSRRGSALSLPRQAHLGSVLRFFSDPLTENVLASLARVERLTVIVGAGASVEVGLPSWADLVHALLDEVIAEQGWTEDAERFRTSATEAGTLLTAAELVAALVPEADLKERIFRLLYGGEEPASFRPGPLTRAVATLQAEFGDRMTIATTNYDQLLEAALRNQPGRWWREVRSYVKAWDVPPAIVSVTHLHGLLGSDRKGTVVLTEGDYHRMQLRRSWQEEWMVRALAETSCLFVGASMTDVNLVRYLVRAGDVRRHVAVFRRLDASTADEERFRRRWETAERARWERLGITPLYADHYADIAQLVHELAWRRRLRAERKQYVSLPARLGRWFIAEASSGSLYNADAQGYRVLQQELHDALNELLDGVRELLTDGGVSVGDEPMAATLWAIWPADGPAGQERAVQVAHSDRIMTTVTSIAPIEATVSSAWTGIKALQAGRPIGEAKEIYASRWRYVYGIPVLRENPRMPLGAVTLSTVAGEDSSPLVRAPGVVRAEIDRFVNATALALLDTGGLGDEAG